ncbi:hypothetical protein DFH08DRAFT_821866 [Mycena albidolilacea]|uniref:Uncharacterized protein n=1 Tax=Mycena albidolilacea TaxID=1033008 RepID=A0AAD6Z9W5_9AGAR|nr:hypothetical protein DFH08DRAFT_821866 [Mycena albidolilacea]
MSGEAHHTESTTPTAEKNVRTRGVESIQLNLTVAKRYHIYRKEQQTGEGLIGRYRNPGVEVDLPRMASASGDTASTWAIARERWRRDKLFRIFEWNAPWYHGNRSRRLQIRTVLLDDLLEYLGTVLAGEKPVRLKASLEPSILVRKCSKKKASLDGSRLGVTQVDLSRVSELKIFQNPCTGFTTPTWEHLHPPLQAASYGTSILSAVDVRTLLNHPKLLKRVIHFISQTRRFS